MHQLCPTIRSFLHWIWYVRSVLLFLSQTPLFVVDNSLEILINEPHGSSYTTVYFLPFKCKINQIFLSIDRNFVVG